MKEENYDEVVDQAEITQSWYKLTESPEDAS